MDNQDRNGGGKPWGTRRIIIMLTLVFCASWVTHIVLFGEDTRVNETVILGCFGLAGAVIGSYVFGAVWDDKNRNNK